MGRQTLSTEANVKYFPYELIASANGWGDETVKQQAATHRFERAVTAYHRHLDTTRPKVPAAAWRLFRHGNPGNTLHDSRLVCLNVGDIRARALGWPTRGRGGFAASARLEFLTYAEDRLYVFDCRQVHKIESNLFIPQGGKEIGDLYTYELRTASSRRLAIGFLFASGATIELEFERLMFRVQRARAAQQGAAGRRAARAGFGPVQVGSRAARG